jgi:hypothetical protein
MDDTDDWIELHSSLYCPCIGTMGSAERLGNNIPSPLFFSSC